MSKYWNFDPMTKSIESKDRDIEKKMIQKAIKDSVKRQNASIRTNFDLVIDPINKSMDNTIIGYEKQYLKKVPQNFDFRMQGGKKYGIKSGMAKYLKGGNDYKLKDSTINFLKGGFSPNEIAKNIMNKVFVEPVKRGLRREMEGGAAIRQTKKPTKAQLDKVEELRGKMANNKKQYTDYFKPEYVQQRLEANIWRKGKQGKEKLSEIADLTNDEKMAYSKQQSRRAKNDYNKQMDAYREIQANQKERAEAKQERDWQEEERYRAWEERENARLAKESGGFWDDVTGTFIDGVSGLLPGPLKGITKGAMKGLQSGLKGLGVKKPLSAGQKTYQNKIKYIMQKEGLSFKDALKNLKHYK